MALKLSEVIPIVQGIAHSHMPSSRLGLTRPLRPPTPATSTKVVLLEIVFQSLRLGFELVNRLHCSVNRITDLSIVPNTLALPLGCTRTTLLRLRVFIARAVSPEV